MEQRIFVNLIVLQLVKKFSDFYVVDGSFLCSQEPATCPYLEPDEYEWYVCYMSHLSHPPWFGNHNNSG
jgi:hypothetical protein